MSTNKPSAYITQVTPSVMVAGTNGSIPAHLLGPLQWLLGWLARWQKGKPDSIGDVDYELDDERFVKDGKTRGSAQQAARERAIDVQWVMLRVTRNR